MKPGLEADFYNVIDGRDRSLAYAIGRLLGVLATRIRTPSELRLIEQISFVLRSGSRSEKSAMRAAVKSLHDHAKRRLDGPEKATLAKKRGPTKKRGGRTGG